MRDSLGVLVGADDKSEAEVGELVFVPKGSRVVAKGSELEKMIGVDENKVQVVEVLDDPKVHTSKLKLNSDLLSHFHFLISQFRSTKGPLLSW